MDEADDPRLGVPLRWFLDDGRDTDARRNLSAYFTEVGKPDDHDRTYPLFTGALFERFAASSPADEIVEADLLAVSALGVTVPPRAAGWLLGDGSDQVRALLRAIRSDRSIREVYADVLGPGSPATELWDLVRSLPGVGEVTAGKLLAAKRPHLIPVWDQHVHEATRAPNQRFWLAMRQGVIEDGDRFEALRNDLGRDVSLLRVIDVVVWMHQHGHAYLAQ